MVVLISLSVVTFGFGIFIFSRGQHSMHQLQALIFFLISALFLSTALLLQEIREFFARRRRVPAASKGAAAPDTASAVPVPDQPHRG